MQTVGNQTGGPFEKLEVLIAEGIQFIAIGIEHTENVPVVVAHWHNNLGTSCMEGRQMAKILAHVVHDDGFARIQCRTAQTLRNRKTRVSCRLVPGFFACSMIRSAKPESVPMDGA